MFRIKVLIFMTLAAVNSFCVFAEAKRLTTNDVDEVFVEMSKIGGAPFWYKCKISGLRDTTIPQPEIRRYALDKLLNLPISTNTLRFVARIRAYADYIERSESLFGMKHRDEELRKILHNVQQYQLIPTDDLDAMGDRAQALYEQKYPQRARLYVNGMRREFIDEWMWHRNRVLDWNKEIAEYRRKLIAFVCRKYHEIHADVPEKERTEALVRLLSEYGFSLPKGNEPSNP